MTEERQTNIASLLFLKIGKKSGRIVGKARRLLGLRYKSAVSEPQLFEFLRGKSVALVGNARGLSLGSSGSAIDGHDVVIRCNRSPLPTSRSHGMRTDFIATSIELERAIMAEKGASHILWMSPPRNALPWWIVRWPNFFLYPQESHRALCANVGNRPTTGLMVIDLLQRSPCRSIDLYGFDFYRSQSLSSEQSRQETPHDYDSEESYVRQLMRNDARFSLN